MIREIVAVDASNAIGWSNGDLPWKIPYDLKRFKELTSGSTVVMGSNTWKSLNRPGGLPNRRNVVISSRDRESLNASGDIQIVKSIEDLSGSNDYWVIGGSQIYSSFLALDLIDEMHITFVHESSNADVKFPVDLYNWKLFMIQQRSIGRPWQLDDLVIPQLGVDIPIPITILTVSRQR